MFKSKILISTLIFLLGSIPAQAQLYVIDSDIYAIDVNTGEASLFVQNSVLASSFGWTTVTLGNSLAYDYERSRLLFTQEGNANPNIYAYDFTSQTVTQLGNMTTLLAAAYPGAGNATGLGNIATNYGLHGGGSFYNGKYYLTYEINLANQNAVNSTTTPGSFLVEVPFTPGGAISSVSIIGGTPNAPSASWNTAAGLGDHGDFTTDVNTGTFYAQTNAFNDNGATIPNQASGFYSYKIDGTTPYTTGLITATTGTTQLAFWNNNIYTANGTNRTLTSINPATGATISTLGITGLPENLFLADMTSSVNPLTGVGIIPEPTTFVLVLLGSAGFVLRRRCRNK
jgi:hypothetical protein